MRRRTCSVENVLHADPESLLPQLEVFEQTLPREGRTALFALFGESLFRVFLFAQQ